MLRGVFDVGGGVAEYFFRSIGVFVEAWEREMVWAVVLLGEASYLAGATFCLGVIGCWGVGFLHVALAVPNRSREVVVPEGVVLGPYVVPEDVVFLARDSGAGRYPADVWIQLGEDGVVVPVGSLLGGAAEILLRGCECLIEN